MALGLKAHITLTDNLSLVSNTSVGQMMPLPPLLALVHIATHSHTHIHTYTHPYLYFNNFFTKASPENLKM